MFDITANSRGLALSDKRCMLDRQIPLCPITGTPCEAIRLVNPNLLHTMYFAF